MDLRPAVTAFILVLGALSGCVSSTGTGSKTSPSAAAPAPVPVANASAGSIAGKVVDDELAPIPGAQISLVERNLEAVTDNAGSFTFNGLDAGEYRLIANKLGYESAARKVRVELAKVTELSLTLKPLSVDETFYLTIPKVAMIYVGESIFHVLVFQTLNNSYVHNLTCDPCRFILYFQPEPKEGLLEVVWPPSGNAYINRNTFIYYKTKWSQGWYIGENDGDTYIPGYRTSGSAWTWTKSFLTAVKDKDRVLMVVNPSYELSFNHRINTYNSFAYNGEFGDNWTALPPS